MEEDEAIHGDDIQTEEISDDDEGGLLLLIWIIPFDYLEKEPTEKIMNETVVELKFSLKATLKMLDFCFWF